MEMITARNLVNHELIGLRVNVVNRRVEGKVVDETMKTLVIETEEGKEKKVEKKGSTFVFTVQTGQRVRVDGHVIAMRPEDRIKKNPKVW